MTFPRLFAPGKIGNLEIKNRIVMAAMGNHRSTDGFVTQRHIDYYTERAKGGVGLITTEGCCVQYPQGKGWQQMSVDNDKYIPGLTRLADAIKKTGARAAMQLHHAGAAASVSLTGGLTPVGPSTISRLYYAPSRALTLDEIKEIKDCFIRAALRAQTAGFDVVELHGAHHYLLGQFHSLAWNERDDMYGGSLVNRVRLTAEIVSCIKNAAPSLPVICRFNRQEYGAREFSGRPGLTLADAIEIAKMLEASGTDAVHISAWGWGLEGTRLVPSRPGAIIPSAAAVKKVVKIPVITVGRITPEIGESALREGKADFIAIGRGLLADPYYPVKAKAGNVEDITPCIGCLECLGGPRMNICTVNARDGQEGAYPYPMVKVAAMKRVIVVGGGPGGMEAARVAALRGHNVTLVEKAPELGGTLPIAGVAPSKENVLLLLPYLVRQVNKAGVTVKLGQKATPAALLAARPDVLIIAAGAKPIKPNIRGLGKTNVANAIDVLAGKAKVGQKVVIIGGELVGCETADFLYDQGLRDITIVRRSDALLTKMRVPWLQMALLHRLATKGVKTHLGVTYKECTEQCLIVIDRNGKELSLPADTIVLAAGSRPEHTLLKLRGKIPEVYVIGDAQEPRQILQAIHEGFKTAYML